MDENKQLFLQYFDQLSLLENIDQVEYEQIKNIFFIFSNQSKYFQELILCYKTKQSVFEYTPLFGSKIQFHFDYLNHKVTIDKEKKSLSLTFMQFNQICSMIDVLFTPIYPLGTVVELYSELFDDEIQSYFSERNLKMYVLLYARRFELDDTYYVDYLGSLWPLGLNDKTEVLSISSYMIKDIVFEGFTNNIDEQYIQDNLRQSFLKQHKLSVVYSED